LTEIPSEEIANSPAPIPKKGNPLHLYLHDMTLLNGREINPSPRMDELLPGERANEDTQPFHHHIPVSDPHLVIFKSDVLPRGIGREASPIRGEDALLHLDSISIDHPEKTSYRDLFHRMDVANFEGFPFGNGGHEEDPVIIDIPDLKGGEGKDGR